MTTTLAKTDIERKWHLVDAEGLTLGRLAVKIANLLRGRNKTIYTPFIDSGDFVVVVNADKVKLSGKKEQDKQYMFYTGYRGNEYYRTVEEMRKRRPTFILEHAVKGMLPRNKLASKMLTRLRLFVGPNHTHEAQNPTPFNA